jgi:hypothetical protein
MEYFFIGDNVQILRYKILTIGIVKTIGIWNGMIEVKLNDGKIEWYEPKELKHI